MSSIKVMTLVGTRPEIIKLSRVIVELDKHVEHVLVHSGQNYDYELNQIFFEDLGLRKPDYFLDAVGETTAETIGKIIIKTDEMIERIKPDAILIYGDTNTGLGVIPAKRRHIPVFHMEAGNRSFDERIPEEMNRRVIDHLSDINMPLTEHARKYLEREGIAPETIIKTGSCMKEVLNFYRGKIDQSAILQTLTLEPRGYFLVSAHREENVDTPQELKSLLSTLNALAERYDKRIVVSTHPRTRQRLKHLGYEHAQLDSRIEFLKPFAFSDYVKLQENAFCVLSDSGTISEECALLNIPGVNLRRSHERPEAMDCAIVVMCGMQPERVMQAVAMVTQQYYEQGAILQKVEDYEVDNVSTKVVRIIQSHVDSVLWRNHFDQPQKSASLETELSD